MNIKKMSSKVLAIALSIMMLATAVYAGFATVFTTKASEWVHTEYESALRAYSFVDGKGHNLSTDKWTFNIVEYGDITTDPHNPVAGTTYPATENGINGLPETSFGDNTVYKRHRRDLMSVPYFNFLDDNNAQEIQFHLVDNGSRVYGAEFYYTIDSKFAGKILDWQGNLIVRNNESGAGTVYYRLVTTDANGVKTAVWPEDGKWYTLDFNSSNLNPDGYIFPAEIPAQAVGNKIGVECYVDMTSGKGVDVSFGYPAFNYVAETLETVRGSAQRYYLHDYFYLTMYGNLNDRYPDSRAYFSQNDARVEFGYFTTVEGTSLVANQFYPYSCYYTDWSMYWASVPNSQGKNTNVGYHTHYFNNKEAAVPCELGYGTGISYRLAVPYDGTVLIDISAYDGNNTKGYMRVMQNGEQVYPTEGNHLIGEKDDANKYTKVGVAASKGDFIEVQVYSPVAATSTSVIKSFFTVIAGEYQNLPSNSVFAASFDAPYPGKQYTGEYAIPSDSIYRFDLYDAANQQTVSVDSYDSKKDNLLYNAEKGDYGYRFKGNDVYAVMAPSSTSTVDAGLAAAVSFVLPADGAYDMAIGGKITKGSGTLKYRVQKEGVPFYPEDGSWITVSSEDGFVPIEISGLANSSAVVQYAVTDSNDKTVEVNLGPVTVYKRTSDIPSNIGLWSNYGAATYIPAVWDQYSGAITKQAARFNFYAYNKANDTKQRLDVYSDVNKVMTLADSTVALDFNTTALAAKVKAGNGLGFTFYSAKEAAARVTMQPSANTQYRILLNGQVVIEWTAADGNLKEHIVPDTKVNDKIDVQFSSDADCTVTFGTPSVSYAGAHQDNNDPSQKLFYAFNSFPYLNLDYSGTYTAKTGIWNYDTLNVSKADGSVTYAQTDMYDGVKYKLYTEATGAGYVFGQSSMTFDFTTSADAYHGMSLRFVAPKENGVAYDLSVIAPSNLGGVTAKYRVMLGDEQLWPTDGSWKTETLKKDKALDLPLLEFSANQGDVIRIDMYLETTAQSTNFNINNPYVRLTGYADFVTPDVTGTAYDAHEYNPYADSSYNGTNIVPDSRWNFEYFVYNLQNNTMTEPTAFGRYQKSWNSLMYISSSNNTGIYMGTTTDPTSTKYAVSLHAQTYVKGQTESYGINLRFISPFDGEAKLVGAPSVPISRKENNQLISSLADGTELYFRILKNGEVIWPENGEWSVGNKENSGSVGFEGMDVELKIGDEIEYQIFTKNSNITDEEKLAVTAQYLGLDQISVLRINSINTTKTKFSSASDWTPYYQISPYWRYVVAADVENPVYVPLSSYHISWGIWRESSYGNLGIQKGSSFLLTDAAYYANAKKHVALGMQFTVPRDGFLCINGTTITSKENNTTGFARITYNGKNLWPEGDGNWYEIKAGSKVTYEDMHFDVKEIKELLGNEDGKVKAGDVISFEMTLDQDTDNDGKDSTFGWKPNIVLSKISTRVSEDTDIYGGLTAVDMDFFKALATKMGTEQFDVDYENSKWEYENRPEEDEEIYDDESEFEEMIGDGELDNDTNNDDDEDNTSSKRRKKKVIKVIISEGLPVGVIIGIIAGGVVVLAAIVFIIILAHKKKAKKNAEAAAAAALAAENAEDTESASDASDSSAENTEE